MANLSEALAGVLNAGVYDVHVVRWVDGHRITTSHSAIAGGAVLALYYQEQCLPGDLAFFEPIPTNPAPESSAR